MNLKNKIQIQIKTINNSLKKALNLINLSLMLNKIRLKLKPLNLMFKVKNKSLMRYPMILN